MCHRLTRTSLPRFVVTISWAGLIVALLPVFAVGQDRCTEPPEGLVAWWPGEGSAVDVIGDWNGTLVGDTDFAAGEVGDAFTFDGSVDYVQVDDASAGDLGADSFTVAFWMKSTTTGSGTYLVGKSHPDGGAAHGWDIRLHGGTIQVVGVNGWAINITSDAVIEADTWHHVAVSSDDTTVRLYVDGAVAGTCARQTISTSPNPLRFGYTTNFGGSALQGQLDEIQLFDRALSEGEIQVLRQSVPGGSCRPCLALPEGAVAWWRAEDDFDDAAGRFNGAPVNGVPFDDWVVGRAFVFDGSQDYVALPDDDVWDFGTGSFSISAWIQTERSGYRNIIRYHNGSSGGYWGVRTETTGKLQFIVADAAGYTTERSIVSTDVVNDESPHLITAVRDAGAGELRLYIDGMQAAPPVSDNGVNIIGAADAFPAIGALAYPGGSAAEFFAGYVDEVVVFDRVITADEAAAIFAAGGQGICHECVEPPSGLVSWWRGDGNTFDAVGGNDGTLQNNTTFAAGVAGQAFSFGAADAHVAVPHDEGLSFGTTDPMSISLWGYRTGGSEDVQHLIGRRSGCSGSAFNYQIVLDSLYNTGLCFATSTGSVHSVCGDGEMSDMPLNTWTHVAATFDGTAKRLFINGREVARGIATLGTPDEAPLTIGTSGTCAEYGQEFRGLIDEVEIYDRALTRDEVRATYRAGAFGRCTDCAPVPEGIEAWWRAEGDATDAAGASDGTAMNGAGYGPGRVGRAFDFDDDAAPDYVEVPHSASLDITGAFSVEGWVFEDELAISTVLVKGDANGTACTTSYAVNVSDTPTDGKINAALYGAYPADRYVSAERLQTGTWHHVALTWDGATSIADNVNLYIDGRRAQSWTKANPMCSTTESLTIGAMKPPTYYGSTDGRIDELSIYSSELTAAEVRAIVAAGAAGKCVDGDSEPDAFTFVDSIGHGTSTIVATDPITVAGIDRLAAITISACSAPFCWYAVNDGPWTTRDGTVEDGDAVYVRQMTASTDGTTTDLTLSIGGVGDTFTATTGGTFMVTVTLAGTGSGTVTSSPAGIDCGATCAAPFDAGGEVTLTATPDAGSVFSGWSGDADCADGEVTMSGDVECTATFGPAEIFSDGFESGDTLEWTLTTTGVTL